VVAVKYKVSVA